MKIIRKQAFVFEQWEFTTSIHNSFDNFNFVDGSLGKSIVVVILNCVHDGVVILL
jgi:hypothetical protein